LTTQENTEAYEKITICLPKTVTNFYRALAIATNIDPDEGLLTALNQAVMDGLNQAIGGDDSEAKSVIVELFNLKEAFEQYH
jgi:hypothetical protein